MQIITLQDYWSNGNYGVFDYRLKFLLFLQRMKEKTNIEDCDELDGEFSGHEHDLTEIVNSKVSLKTLLIY